MILLVLLLSGPITCIPVEAILVVDDRLDLIDAIDLLRDDWVGEGLYDIIRLYEIRTDGLNSHMRSLIRPVDSSAIENR
jgi:hypothetical protein